MSEETPIQTASYAVIDQMQGCKDSREACILISSLIAACENEYKPKWVSVEDRLPECRKDVLLLHKNEWQATACLVDGEYLGIEQEYMFLLNDENGLYLQDVTHWMPLPEPPA